MQPSLTPRRKPGRMHTDKATAYAVLDEALVTHVGFVVDGHPRVLPMAHARIDDTLYLHGSSGMTTALAAGQPGGLRASATVTLLDGLVLAPSQFNHSVNYRSVIAYGTIRSVEDLPEKRAALTALINHVAPGRAADAREPTAKELAQTAVLALPLDHCATKVRTGSVADTTDPPPAEPERGPWVGVLPLEHTAGTPIPEPGWTAPLPDYLLDYRRRATDRGPWYEPVAMTGQLVRLEPLSLAHVDELYAATRDREVWTWLSAHQPVSPYDMARIVGDALKAPTERVAWAQLDTATGRAVGTTSYYWINTEHRSLAIGHTFLGRDWWRSGINAEAKLLLLQRAFETLRARRVVLQTDARNVRSQEAISRLGAVREGVFRNDRVRPDGTSRDTVQFAIIDADWPSVRERLRSRLDAGAHQPS